ncbi:MAG: hypothetical protein Q4A78_12090, partial [Peptostreptococcaceae bacterium]|nr:hypothetical protein [Peptostreptococcaceae bacterium]
EEIEEIERLFQKKGFSFSNHGKNSLRKWIRKFGFSEVLISAEISINQYLKDESSVEKTFNYIPRICSGRKKELEDPLFQKKNYIIGIIRNKGYCNVQKVRRLLDQVLVDQESEQVLREMSYQCAGSTSFLRMAEEYFSLDIE